jgi:hypothetical protein
MNKIPKALKKELVRWLVSGGAIIVFLVSTAPLKLPLPVLLIPFMLFVVWVRSGLIVIGMLLRKQTMPSRKIKVLASGAAAIALLVLTLQSLGQLSWRDISLIAALTIGLIVYFVKTDLI